MAEVKKVEEQFRQEVTEWAVDIEERITVTKSEVWAPPRPPDPIHNGTVKLKKKIDMVPRIVGAPEIARQASTVRLQRW